MTKRNVFVSPLQSSKNTERTFYCYTAGSYPYHHPGSCGRNGAETMRAPFRRISNTSNTRKRKSYARNLGFLIPVFQEHEKEWPFCSNAACSRAVVIDLNRIVTWLPASATFWGVGEKYAS